MTKQRTKIFIATHNEDMNSDEKCRNLGRLGLGVTQGHQQHSHSIEHIRLPIRL